MTTFAIITMKLNFVKTTFKVKRLLNKQSKEQRTKIEFTVDVDISDLIIIKEPRTKNKDQRLILQEM
jgi:hypothetical protein